MAEIARSYVGRSGSPVDRINVSRVLKGSGDNKGLLAACEAKALELLKQEACSREVSTARPAEAKEIYARP